MNGTSDTSRFVLSVVTLGRLEKLGELSHGQVPSAISTTDYSSRILAYQEVTESAHFGIEDKPSMLPPFHNIGVLV